MEFGKNIVITGIIMPSNWDDTGRITEIALYTNKEEVYAVKLNSLTGELLNLLYRCVEIRGKIREHPEGNKTIVAQDYRLQRKFFKGK